MLAHFVGARGTAAVLVGLVALEEYGDVCDAPWYAAAWLMGWLVCLGHDSSSAHQAAGAYGLVWIALGAAARMFHLTTRLNGLRRADAWYRETQAVCAVAVATVTFATLRIFVSSCGEATWLAALAVMHALWPRISAVSLALSLMDDGTVPDTLARWFSVCWRTAVSIVAAYSVAAAAGVRYKRWLR